MKKPVGSYSTHRSLFAIATQVLKSINKSKHVLPVDTLERFA